MSVWTVGSTEILCGEDVVSLVDDNRWEIQSMSIVTGPRSRHALASLGLPMEVLRIVA